MTNLEAAQKVQREVEHKVPYHVLDLMRVQGINVFWLPLLVALDAGLLVQGNIPWDQRDNRGRFLPRPKQ
jgi:hypothetical protein